ncbi:MAG: 50S ribosomal protein L4 [Clostridiales bacterium]|nr:50S ribosomal protein L4 [Clostridiales bacterium]
MPRVNVYNIEGEKVSTVTLKKDIFEVEVNTHVLHTVVRAQLANKRQGTKGTLTRTEVAGGGRKPFRQKGTGRSRQGSSRSPQYYKGGVVFAPKSRDFSITVPKKVKRLALKGALTSKATDKDIIILDALEIEAKTKAMVKVLANLKVEGKAYIINEEPTANVERAAANIPGVKTGLVNTINVVDILNHDKLILTKAALKKLEEVYA